MIENDWTWLTCEDEDDDEDDDDGHDHDHDEENEEEEEKEEEEEYDDDFVEVSMYRMCVAQWHGEELMATLLGCCGDTKYGFIVKRCATLLRIQWHNRAFSPIHAIATSTLAPFGSFRLTVPEYNTAWLHGLHTCEWNLT